MNSPNDIVRALAAVWFVAVGLAIGSFLNVVIARVPHGESIVRPRSRCPHCGHSLPWYENIPVFSWLWLRGRCSGCKAPISWRYPAVELLTAALFYACLARFDWTWELLGGTLLVVLVVPLTFIDLEHWILPFELTKPGMALGVLSALPLGLGRTRDALIGTVVGFGVFWALERLGRKAFGQEALGAGDKYLLALLGGFLTYHSLLGVILFACLQGSIVGLSMRALTGRAGPAPAQGPTPPPDLAGPPEPVEPPAREGEQDDDWVPGPSNLPFGPWLATAGVELLLLGPWLNAHLPAPLGALLTGTG